MSKESTMVYRKPSEGAVDVTLSSFGWVEFMIVDLEINEAAPGGWVRNYGDLFSVESHAALMPEPEGPVEVQKTRRTSAKTATVAVGSGSGGPSTNVDGAPDGNGN